MVIWTLARKDLRLLLRDARAMIILLAMPLIFIFVLGISLGEGFGKKAEDTLRVSVLDLDQGVERETASVVREAAGWLASGSGMSGPTGALSPSLAQANRPEWNFPYGAWKDLVLKDLRQTANIRVELIESRAQAEELIRSHRRAAVLVLGPDFSNNAQRCSFLADGINPFFRDGVNLKALDVEVLRDPTQATASAIIDQVVQGSLLRVIMPWMIGRAFERIGEPAFLDLLAKDKRIPGMVKTGLSLMGPAQRRQFSTALQDSLQNLFPKYNLTAKTWAALTKDLEHSGDGASMAGFREEGAGFLKRGAVRYQLLVPSYLVMFAFFLVLTVGWLFVAERRQGTIVRLAAAPIARWQILVGKLLPCLVLSLFQGFFILGAGKLIFDMSWGPDPIWLIPVVASTSLAAMGLAMLVAAVARTETQVAIYGTLLVLVLAGLSGSLMGDRSLMPEQMQELSRVTPHAWALEAYRELLTSDRPDVGIVLKACGVLAGFGVAFLAIAWGFLRLEK